jgi:hypothetical protein
MEEEGHGAQKASREEPGKHLRFGADDIREVRHGVPGMMSVSVGCRDVAPESHLSTLSEDD